LLVETINLCPGRPVRGFFFREIARPHGGRRGHAAAEMAGLAKSWRRECGLRLARYSLDKIARKPKSNRSEHGAGTGVTSKYRVPCV
jgi:hypothetical protein